MLQNPGTHLDGRIEEDDEWKNMKMICIPNQRYDVPSGQIVNPFIRIILV